MHPSYNVLDEPLSVCSENPLTGFFRDGCCNTNDDDVSSHTICVDVTEDVSRICKVARK